MKPYLITTLSACALLPSLQAEDAKPVPATPAPKPSPSVITSGTGTLTITKNADGTVSGTVNGADGARTAASSGVIVVGKDGKPAGNTYTGSTTVTASTAPGAKQNQAVITIDANGKKETRVIDLGNGGTGSGTLTITNNADGSFSGTVNGAPGAPASAYSGVITVGKDGKLAGNASAGTISVSAAAVAKPVTWLGVSTESLNEETAAQLPLDPGTGLIVRHIVAGSPAELAGLQTNDVLSKLEDQILTNPEQLRALLRSRKAGDSVKFTYFRKGKSAEATAKLVTKDLAEAGETNTNWNFGGGLEMLGGLLKKLDGTVAPLTIQNRIVVDSDGKVVEESLDEARQSIEAAMKKLEGVFKDSAESEQLLENVKKELETVLKKRDDAKTPSVK